MTDFERLTHTEIKEIIKNSNHTSYASIKEFHDEGLLEVFPSKEDVWSGYHDDEKVGLIYWKSCSVHRRVKHVL